MASIIQGYEYDIFISYRQKDNKYDGWVTEFVNNLRKELEATFKDDVSIYFDENPHDGILDTYNVDKSLENKLKCLIFIPIISQTYCDPKSFAWQNEFIAFNRASSNDLIGSNIKLSNGNVTGRILPAKIHEIDAADKNLIEIELGGTFRSIDFIFKSSGVNRPLKPDDSRNENLNHTYYRDQINKLANAIKEIITALQQPDLGDIELIGKKIHSTSKKISKKGKLKIASVLFVIALVISGYFLLHFLPNVSNSEIEKSIAVLPFENMSNEPDQDYFSNGMMQEIMNHLFKIGGLKIPSSTSSMRYKGSKLPVKQIARELNVSYVLEGNVSSSGNNVRIIVRMINGKNERLVWSEDYEIAKTATNLLEIQSEVARQVAKNMKISLSPDVKNRIETKLTSNTEAYNLYLRAQENWDNRQPLLERAIVLDPGFAEAYAQLAYCWIERGMYDGDLDREHVLEKAEPLIEKALQLDMNSAFAHTIKAAIRLWFYWDFASVEKEYIIFTRIAPSDIDYRRWFTDYLIASGRFNEAVKITKMDFDMDSISPEKNNYMVLAYYFNDEQKKSLETLENAMSLYPKHKFLADAAISIYVYTSNYKKAIETFDEIYKDSKVQDIYPRLLGYIGISYLKTGNYKGSASFLKELIYRSGKSPTGSPSFAAAGIYTAKGENDKAIQCLEKGYADHEVEMYWINVEPLFKPLHGDPRFENILKKIGFK